MTMDTEMLASSVPDKNKRRSVVAGKFQKALKEKFGDKYKAPDKKADPKADKK